jgi:hypothetical protein
MERRKLLFIMYLCAVCLLPNETAESGSTIAASVLIRNQKESSNTERFDALSVSELHLGAREALLSEAHQVLHKLM